MSNIIQQFEAEQMGGKVIPEFRAGDSVSVKVRVKEGTRERLQAFEGIVIAMRRRGLNSAFTVRKVSHGEGVERVFQMYSPIIESIAVIRLGDVVQNCITCVTLRVKQLVLKKKFKRKHNAKQPMQNALLYWRLLPLATLNNFLFFTSPPAGEVGAYSLRERGIQKSS